jgi:protein TonB
MNDSYIPRAGNLISAAPDPARKPVCIEVPVTVQGLPDKETRLRPPESCRAFCEEARTVVVYSQGAVVRLPGGAEPGQRVVLTNKWMNKEVLCRVVPSKAYAHVKGYVELEFTQPVVGFWGIRFPNDAANLAEQPETTPRTPDPVMADPPAPAQPAQKLGASAAAMAPPASAAAASFATPASPAVAEAPFDPLPLADPIREPRSVRVPTAAPAHRPSLDERRSPSLEADAGVAALRAIPNLPLHSDSVLQTSLPAPRRRSRRTVFFASLICVGIAVLGASLAMRSADEGATNADTLEFRMVPPTPPADMVAPRQDALSQAPPQAAPAAEVPATSPATPETATSPANAQAPQAAPVEESVAPGGKAEATQRKAVPSLQLAMPVRKPAASTPASEVPVEALPEVSGAAPAGSQPDLAGISSAVRQPPPPPAPKPLPTSTLKMPRLISSVPPVYPAAAKKHGFEGDVVVEALIDVSGRVTEAKVLSGPTILHLAAEQAVLQWRYEPAVLNGKPLPFKLNVTLQFRLRQ